MAIQTKETSQTFIERLTPRWVSRRIAAYKKAGWQRFYERIRKDTGIAHVNDCADNDAQARLIGRSSEILGRFRGFNGVSTDLEGAGGIITALDALNGASDSKTRKHKNVILANVAPRNGDAAKKYENGSPFCYFWHEGTLVVTTVDGLTLSLVKKFKLTNAVHVLDTRATLEILKKAGMISEEEEARIAETQFRSFEFSPRIAAYLLRYGKIKSAKEKNIEEIQNAPAAVWLVDKFATYGNVKTTLIPEDVFPPETVEKLKSGSGDSKDSVGTLETRFGTLPVYRRLKDVPLGALAVVVGSSGYKEKRFLEIVVNGGSAAKELGVSVGDTIFEEHAPIA